MKSIRTMLAATIVAATAGIAWAAQPAAPRDVECEASKSPAAASTMDRAQVKGEAAATAKSYECVDIKTAPAATSAKSRSEVKAEGAAAMKSGEMPRGEAAITGR